MGLALIRLIGLSGLVSIAIAVLAVSISAAQEKPTTPATKPAATATAQPAKPPGKFPDWNKVTEGSKKLEGLFPLYFNEKEQKLFMEISPGMHNKQMICPISIARGAGMMYLGGDTLNFGNQWIISFKRLANNVLVTRHNVGVRAKPGSPQADALKTSYTDSIIAALPIRSEKGSSVLVDLGDLLMTDFAGIGARPDRKRSSWAKVRTYPRNVEIQVAAVFPMGVGGGSSIFGGDSVPDPRGVQIVIHYGLSLLSNSSYKPRVADDRVGHFLSMVQDFSTDNDESPYVRYVTRWQLARIIRESGNS